MRFKRNQKQRRKKKLRKTSKKIYWKKVQKIRKMSTLVTKKVKIEITFRKEKDMKIMEQFLKEEILNPERRNINMIIILRIR
jgi:hypothetical protein